MFLFVFPLWNLPDISRLKDSHPAETAMMRYRRQQAKSRHLKYRIRQKWLPYDRIPQTFRKAVIFSEDAEFFYHEGIDWYEMKMAIKDFLFEHRSLRGASTISQQVVKNLYLNPERSFYRKIKEFWMVKKLEETLGKKRILELYLNIAEWGPGIYGCGAAAKYWFKKDISRLTDEQMIALAVLLPSPLHWSPLNPNAGMRKKIAKIKKILLNNGYISSGKKTLARPAENKIKTHKTVPQKIENARIKIDSLGKDAIIP